ncbi:putative cation exchanger c3a12.06c [Acrodontium crateriforme]|uniref:Cation exchanger c3a12.06c n=1 Tax=Acrodontium crateriforme TaxID=150365 RepID=A0AAQ3MA68_9PEZI|nr:putative cation exchanger c3a12.06c [Acrodontium crateriforme]
MSSTILQEPRHAAFGTAKLKRPSYRAARAFYLTLLIGLCFATYTFLLRPGFLGEARVLQRREAVGILQNAEEECRAVHNSRSSDQCAYIKQHCPEDEPGFAAYLDLYYCRLAHVKPVAFIILIAWLGLLFSTIGIAASDFFCINLSTIASILGMSESMAGVTLLAFGNGSPDVFSTFAAMSANSGSLAVGELFGAAGFITAVVAGSMALIRPFHVAKKSFVRDVGFFVVAAGFSLVFLWDGKLQMWETVSMVGYYIFYVFFVVAWHWWLNRRRQRREKEAAARGHYIAPGDDLDGVQEEYHDDPEDGSDSRPRNLRTVSVEDWAALERSIGEDWVDETGEDDKDYEDLEEEARERWMSELSSNMRLTRPMRSRKNTTKNPVRPSLVGALEFQAVFKSLQRSRNHQTIPLNSRRYSDDPTYTTAQRQDAMSTSADPAARPPFQVTLNEGNTPTMERPDFLQSGRLRALSANGAADLRITPAFASRILSPTREETSETPARDGRHSRKSSLLEVPGSGMSSTAGSPNAPLAPMTHGLRTNERSDQWPTSQSPDHLSPTGQDFAYQRADSFPKSIIRRGTDKSSKSVTSPQLVPSARSLPKIVIPKQHSSRGSTPSASPFPRYRDATSPITSGPPSIHLPPPSIASPESLPDNLAVEEEEPIRPYRWWPYSILPPPRVIISTLFPTIYHWHEKTWWEKLLGIVAAPSVFLLTITLPVVESEKDGDDSDLSTTFSHQPTPLHSQSYDTMQGQTASIGEHDGMAGHGSSATAAVSTEQEHRHNLSSASQDYTASQTCPTAHNQHSESWNRWLTITHLFLSPIFVLLSIWNQSPIAMDAKWLIKPILISLLVSTILLVPVLASSTPTHRPLAYRIFLSSAGFVVSIAWISAIASEVVGVLKALAVILNMSHAIMGLTIFAVGNSLGDLVADATVARLGFPVMALSACLGGPMLNILLGIGLSGSYIMLRGAAHRHQKHPEKEIKFESFEIEVETTLIVSGITLLVTLIGLLVIVPLNKWVLSKRIGWALIALWTLSTIGNVILEVKGWTGRRSSS